MKIYIVLLLVLFNFVIFSKENKKLDSVFYEIMNSDGLARTRLIDKLYNFPIKKVISKTKEYLNSSNIEDKDAAAEISGIFKDKSYIKIIKKELKKAKDFNLINSLIFSIGENKYHKLGNMLCKYINDKKHMKPAYFALIKLKDKSCFRQFKRILQKKDYKKQLPVLEFITKTKNKRYLRYLKYLFKKTKNSSIKYSSAIALLVLGRKDSFNYIKNYLNNDLNSSFLKLKAYKNLERLIDKDNINSDKIFLNGVNDKDEYTRLFCIMTMVKRDRQNKLSVSDINFIESFSDTQNPQIYSFYSEYKRYLAIHRKKIKKVKNENELARPE